MQRNQYLSQAIPGKVNLQAKNDLRACIAKFNDQNCDSESLSYKSENSVTSDKGKADFSYPDEELKMQEFSREIKKYNVFKIRE